MRIAATPARRGALTVSLLLSLMAIAVAQSNNLPLLRVLKTGLGSGTVTGGKINCGTVCDAEFATPGMVTLMASPDPDGKSTFAGWGGDCSGTGTPPPPGTPPSPSCTVSMDAPRAVTAEFRLKKPITEIMDFTPKRLQDYLDSAANDHIDTPARFIAALPEEYRLNWILMSRSESLQTGTARMPRILMPSADARFTFSVGMSPHRSYPGAHPNAIEYMQWDAGTQKEPVLNFRFHEIVLAKIDALPPPPLPATFPVRERGVYTDDYKCSKCHSTKNVINHTTSNGTSGPPGNVKFKNKPNWDTYDSWGGMLPFNRDRIYQDSVEDHAFRRIFNLWNWRGSPEKDGIRQILEQLGKKRVEGGPVLALQPHAPAGTPHSITRNLPPTEGKTAFETTTDTGHIVFGFDPLPPLPVCKPGESRPACRPLKTGVAYSFGGPEVDASDVEQGVRYVTLRHSTRPQAVNDDYSQPVSDEGRGVRFFDLLSGLDLNPRRIADELIDHRFATGSVAIDVRPITLAIAMGCLDINPAGGAEPGQPPRGVITPPLKVDFEFFNSRNDITGIKELLDDTLKRARSLPTRKADIQKLNLIRVGDPYLLAPEDGHILQPGPVSPEDIGIIRQEVFERPLEANLGFPDSTIMRGIYVDREHGTHDNDVAGRRDTHKIALFRYFLEPLGVSVDKWSMGVRGRSRTYTFADLFPVYLVALQEQMQTDLEKNPVPGHDVGRPTSCPTVIPLVDFTLGKPKLPGIADVPKYTDVQRIFNKSCIECHGGLHYPPYHISSTSLNLAEEELPPAGTSPLKLPHSVAEGYAYSLQAPLYTYITNNDETCRPKPNGRGEIGMMPCGGPKLTKADIETIRRWIVGSAKDNIPIANYSEGDPHIQTTNGVQYDFQSAGEFVLARDLGVEVQVRQTAVPTVAPLPPDPHTGLSSCVSINTAAGVRVGPHRITYQPGERPSHGRGPELRIDGQLTTLSVGEIRLPAGGRVFRASPGSNLQIDTPGGTVINITSNWWAHRQLWYMNINVRQSRATEGLMGAVVPNNWLPALPDGTLLGPQPASRHARYVNLYETFANAWRVTDATSLFDYAPETSTSTFTMEGWPGENPTRCDVHPLTGAQVQPGRGPQRPLDKRTAERVCGTLTDANRRNNCVLDVMVTGERGFATAYAATERRERNQFPQPVTLDSPADRVQTRGSVVFSFSETTDLETPRVTYRQCIWPTEEQFTLNDCDRNPIKVIRSRPGMLTRTTGSTPSGVALKSGGSYFWKVIVEDDDGGLTESQTRRFVVR